MNFAILSVGTELTTGQILNRNAQWIAQKINEMGFEVVAQLTVPDEDGLILKALETLAPLTDRIFITGGLGPTVDDFTRDVVAKWAKLELNFDKASWEKITKQLNERNVPVRDSHRQECMFPLGASILENSEGTANGFSLQITSKKVYVLPGPPNEIAAIWSRYIQSELKGLISPQDQFSTWSWDTMGLAESELADLLKQTLMEDESRLAYRVHRPYVEVKLRFREREHSQAKALSSKIEKAISAYTIVRNGDTLSSQFEQKLTLLAESIHKIEFLSTSHLSDLTKNFSHLSEKFSISFSNELNPSGQTDLSFALNKEQVSVHKRGVLIAKTQLVPTRPNPTAKWHLAWQFESALLYWLKYV